MHRLVSAASRAGLAGALLLLALAVLRWAPIHAQPPWDVRALPLVWIAGHALHDLLAKRRPFLTAKRLLTNQTFRDIYRTDTLDVDQGLKITSLTFLFTDLKGSTALYDRVGDIAAYDLVRRFERLPETAQDDLGLPDLRFVFFQTGVLFDHQYHTLRVVVNARIDGDPALAHARATERIDAIERRLAEPAAHIPIELSDPDEPFAAGAPQFASTMSRAEFISAVENERFDNNQNGLLRFDFTLVINPKKTL